MISRKAGAGVALSACSLLWYSGSWADPGLEATLGVSQRLGYVEESGFTPPRRDGLRSVTGLAFGLSSETRTQRLVFGASTDLVLGSEEDGALDIENPFLTLGYGIEGKRSALDVAASFRNTDVDREIFFLEADDEPTDLTDDSGSVNVVSLRSTLTLGREGPVGLVLNHSYVDRSYIDTTDPDLLDSTTQSVSARTFLVLSPVATVGFDASYRDFSEAGVDGNSRTNASIGIDGEYRLSKVTSVSAGLSQQRVESSTDPTQEGPGLFFGVQHERPDGVMGFSLAHDQTINGDRTEASVSRSYVFPRGLVSASLGLSRTGDLEVLPIGAAQLSYELGKLSQFTMAFSQRSATSADNTEVVLTRISVGLSQDLTAQSSLLADMEYVSRDDVGAGGNDQSSVRAGLTYRYGLNNDWDFVSGYEYILNREDARADSTTSSVFLGIERIFSFRP